jgi:hypothetical protein
MNPIPSGASVVDHGAVTWATEEVRTAVVAAAVALMMVGAGVTKKQLVWRPGRRRPDGRGGRCRRRCGR